jgi:phage gp36-like protein
MGGYATTTSISDLAPGYLQDDTTSVDQVGAARFSRHIDRAESMVNAAVGRRYALPFIVATTTTNVPPLLRTLTEDIATYYALRGSFSQDGKVKNPYLVEYESAIKLLKEIAAGTMPLTYTDGSEVPANSSNLFLSSTKDYVPVFGLDDAPDWRRDPDEERAKEAERQET